jgi:small subunit ribosomal protein S1
MEILIAKNAGFCFGVQNAMNKANTASNEDGKVFTYGPIIHNKQVVENLKSQGIDVINEISEAKEEDRIIIRSHGISKNEYDMLLDKKANIIDATCPYVKYIHDTVEKKCNEGYKIIIIGDPNHPEVKGINGWCSNNALIINGEQDIDNISNNLGKICVVAQTTYNQEKWYSFSCRLLKLAKEIVVFNTICNSTEMRQKETLELSKEVDVMIVVGGKESSNTRKLYEICKENCTKTIFIETADELNLDELKGANKVGITAGASTPEYAIEDLVNKIKTIEDMSESKQVEVTPETQKESDEKNDIYEYFKDFKEVHIGSVVEGKVILVTDKEVFIDIGYKSDGVLPFDEVSNLTVGLKAKYEVGDSVKVEVIKMNDGEGNVVLSRKSLEKHAFFDEVKKYKENGTAIEVNVKAVIKGGLSCTYGDIKAFLPMSLLGLDRDEDESKLVGKKITVNINEVKEKKDDIELVVSRKEIMRQEKSKKTEAFLEELESGQTYAGTVKAIIDVGAFVNIGAIDIFVPISEISWKRINKPQDVVSINEKVEIILTRVDKENKKITGSIKRLTKEPWEEFVENYKENDVVEVKIARYAEFGAFAEIIEGVDGLVHISNMSKYKVNRPQERVRIGQKVMAKIIKIDNGSRKVGLSMRDVE